MKKPVSLLSSLLFISIPLVSCDRSNKNIRWIYNDNHISLQVENKDVLPTELKNKSNVTFRVKLKANYILGSVLVNDEEIEPTEAKTYSFKVDGDTIITINTYSELDQMDIIYPNKLDYKVGDKLDLTGMEVYATHKDNPERVKIEKGDGYTGYLIMNDKLEPLDSFFNVKYRGNIENINYVSQIRYRVSVDCGYGLVNNVSKQFGYIDSTYINMLYNMLYSNGGIYNIQIDNSNAIHNKELLIPQGSANILSFDFYTDLKNEVVLPTTTSKINQSSANVTIDYIQLNDEKIDPQKSTSIRKINKDTLKNIEIKVFWKEINQ